jgi:hypothetical protein
MKDYCSYLYSDHFTTQQPDNCGTMYMCESYLDFQAVIAKCIAQYTEFSVPMSLRVQCMQYPLRILWYTWFYIPGFINSFT